MLINFKLIWAAPKPELLPKHKKVKRKTLPSGGTSDKVTIYRVTPRHPVPRLIGEVTVGLNPFGLAYVPK